MYNDYKPHLQQSQKGCFARGVGGEGGQKESLEEKTTKGCVTQLGDFSQEQDAGNNQHLPSRALLQPQTTLLLPSTVAGCKLPSELSADKLRIVIKSLVINVI